MATVREGHQAVLRVVDGQVGVLREAWDAARLTSRCEPSPRTLTLRLTLRRRSLLWSALGLAGCASRPLPATPAEWRSEVMATERVFAQTMADRDHAAFARFIADETVFFSGPTPLRGRQPVIDFWARFYAGPKAPFS